MGTFAGDDLIGFEDGEMAHSPDSAMGAHSLGSSAVNTDATAQATQRPRPKPPGDSSFAALEHFMRTKEAPFSPKPIHSSLFSPKSVAPKPANNDGIPDSNIHSPFAMAQPFVLGQILSVDSFLSEHAHPEENGAPATPKRVRVSGLTQASIRLLESETSSNDSERFNLFAPPFVRVEESDGGYKENTVQPDDRCPSKGHNPLAASLINGNGAIGGRNEKKKLEPRYPPKHNGLPAPSVVKGNGMNVGYRKENMDSLEDNSAIPPVRVSSLTIPPAPSAAGIRDVNKGNCEKLTTGIPFNVYNEVLGERDELLSAVKQKDRELQKHMAALKDLSDKHYRLHSVVDPSISAVIAKKDKVIMGLKAALEDALNRIKPPNTGNTKVAITTDKDEAIMALRTELEVRTSQNSFLTSQLQQLAARADQCTDISKLQEDLKVKTAETNRFRNDLRESNRNLANKQALLNTFTKSTKTGLLRGAMHLVRPALTARLPRNVLACIDCYINNITCDSNACCSHCRDNNERCRRFRCSQQHVLKECSDYPTCLLRHNNEGWLVTERERPQW